MASNTSHKRTASSPPIATTAPATKASKVTDYFKPTNAARSENTRSTMKSKNEKPINTKEVKKIPEPIDEMRTTRPLKKQPPTSLNTKDANPPANPQGNSSSSTTLTLTYCRGDIFSAPPHSLLIHACNTQGSWGAGIAAAFRTRYPSAYKVYRDHCLNTHNPLSNPIPTGTCLLIPPCETTNGKPRHWIGCLFTSAKYGKAKDKPDLILKNTGPAMKDCLGQAKTVSKDGKGVGEVRMCMINSARFAVPWEKTVEVLEGVTVEDGWAANVEIWTIE